MQSFDATGITDWTLADNGGGQFVFTPAPDFWGTQTFTYEVTDGTDVATATASIVVSPVNDAPAFTPGPNPTAVEDAGPQSIAGWATAISSGPANEATQTLAFNVVAQDPALFASGPEIDPATGTLTFTPAPDAVGSTTVTVGLSDDGGTRTAAPTAPRSSPSI